MSIIRNEKISSDNGEMLKVKFPDGSVKEYKSGTSITQIAEGISKSLAKIALVAKINDRLVDLTHTITTEDTNDNKEINLSILTKKDKDNPDVLELVRHDAAHVMAEAVKELFPDTQVTIGPAIENGFYYDFHRETPFQLSDLEKIEKRMREIVDRNEEIKREEWDRDEAIKFFESQGEKFKAEIIRDIPQGQVISLYRQGQFIDLCRGPHLPSTGKLGKNFKLMKLAGAYWRGDAKNPMLQRIYGTAWVEEKDLKDYLMRLEEAEKRDHRKLGKEMELFHQQEEAVGSVFWHPKGWKLYTILQEYMRKRLEKEDYREVNTPELVDRTLWKKSGHWEKFREAMFTVDNVEDKTLAIKPMNCPCHVQIFKQGMKSYRDLPYRMAEFGSCHRNEPSGALHGLFRVRAFTQDDAHIFCSEDQIESETKKFCDLLASVYKDLGFESVKVKFSDRPETRAGTDETWDKAEQGLKKGAEAAGLSYELNPGEGAFYGPKLEFVLTDAIGRDWQCGTLQLDFVLPERLDASYIGEDGERHRPVMLHRAILGSFERFIGILIENYEGKFPLWLAPVQAVVAPISKDQNDYAEYVKEQLSSIGMRVETDLRNEKINYKIREHSLAKIPLIFVVGAKEKEQNSVTLRRLGSRDQVTHDLSDIMKSLQKEAEMPTA